MKYNTCAEYHHYVITNPHTFKKIIINTISKFFIIDLFRPYYQNKLQIDTALDYIKYENPI